MIFSHISNTHGMGCDVRWFYFYPHIMNAESPKDCIVVPLGIDKFGTNSEFEVRPSSFCLWSSRFHFNHKLCQVSCARPGVSSRACQTRPLTPSSSNNYDAAHLHTPGFISWSYESNMCLAWNNDITCRLHARMTHSNTFYRNKTHCCLLKIILFTKLSPSSTLKSLTIFSSRVWPITWASIVLES